MLTWIILSIIAPVPVLHLWLHALLFYWRKRPVFFYLFCGIVWLGSFLLFWPLRLIQDQFFAPSTASDVVGRVLMLMGSLGVLSSIWALGIRRFFMWAVLKPDALSQVRIHRGPFSFIPHPAYFGYLLVLFGNLLTTGSLLDVSIFCLSFALTPIIIWLEERELKERINENVEGGCRKIVVADRQP